MFFECLVYNIPKDAVVGDYSHARTLFDRRCNNCDYAANGKLINDLIFIKIDIIDVQHAMTALTLGENVKNNGGNHAEFVIGGAT